MIRGKEMKRALKHKAGRAAYGAICFLKDVSDRDKHAPPKVATTENDLWPIFPKAVNGSIIRAHLLIHNAFDFFF